MLCMLVLVSPSPARPHALREATGPTATRRPPGVKYNNSNNNNITLLGVLVCSSQSLVTILVLLAMECVSLHSKEVVLTPLLQE
jgi:hypothetical protein